MSMKILERYIAKTVLGSIGLVTLMLVGLQIFILFVDQISDLGRADYGITQAALFVLLQMPYEVYLFFPMASLLGCLIGLGILANHSELVVMRASGMSIGQITWAVLKASVILIVLVTALGETLVPYLSHYANDYKTASVSGGQTLRTSKGSWLRYGNDFISVGVILPDNILKDIYQFRFDVHHHLKMSRFIGEARYTPTGWMAYNIQQTEFETNKTKVQTFASLPWDVAVKPKILMISSIEPDEMTLHELRRYVREQKRNHQNVHNYQFAFLQRLIQPFTTMVMMILSIPFIFGPLRSTTMGSKLLVGAAVGFSFHILSRFWPLSTVFQLPPELAALGPTFIFALLGVYLMRRVK